MDYHLKPFFTVTVRTKVMPKSGIDMIGFSFDFIVSVDESWVGIIESAENIMIEKLGRKYKIEDISITGKD